MEIITKKLDSLEATNYKLNFTNYFKITNKN